MIQSFLSITSKRSRANLSKTQQRILSTSSHDTSDRYILACEASDSTKSDNSSPADVMDISQPPQHILAKAAPNFHSKLGLILNDKRFDNFIFLMIILNSILTAVVTFPVIRENHEKRELCEHLDGGLLIIFTIELMINLMYYGLIDFFNDSWLTFDFIIVTISWAFTSFSVFRIFRALRIIRAVRLIRKMDELRALVTALLNVLPRMFAILLLLSVIFFVFAVLFTELFYDSYEDGITSEDNFSRLDKTAFTLVEFMLLDGWSQITKELMQVYPWAWIPVLLFISITTFVVINLIIAVICDAVASLQTAEMAEHVEDIKNQTADALQETEEDHREQMTRLERKLDSIVYMLSKYDGTIEGQSLKEMMSHVK